MKKLFGYLTLGLFLCTGTVACDSANSSDGKLSSSLVTSDAKAELTFTEEGFDFKEVEEGEVVSHTFQFTNTGKTDLVISDVQTTCGCTTPSWTKRPIAPGEKGIVEVQFDTKGKAGYQNKDVRVIANTNPPQNIITIKATVRAKSAH